MTMMMLLVIALVSIASTAGSTIRKAGCFKDDVRLFSDLIITDINPRSTKFGKQIDMGNYQNSLHSLVSRCHEKAKYDYSYFAIGFLGECWTGSNTKALKDLASNPGSQASSKCFDGDRRSCDDGNKRECAGPIDTMYMYEIIGDYNDYRVVAGGNCKSVSIQQCQTIAQNLNGGTRFTTLSFTRRPPGCYINKEKWYYNYGESTAPCSYTRMCVCEDECKDITAGNICAAYKKYNMCRGRKECRKTCGLC